MLKPHAYIILFLLVFCLKGGAQNIFVLEKSSSGKNMKMVAGDRIKLLTISTQMKVQGIISKITDSSLVINKANEVLFLDIAQVSTDRWGVRFLQSIFLASGLLYVSISALNGIVNNDDPLVAQETLVISGSLVAAALLLTPLTTRTHNIEKRKWKIKILDFTPE